MENKNIENEVEENNKKMEKKSNRLADDKQRKKKRKKEKEQKEQGKGKCNKKKILIIISIILVVIVLTIGIIVGTYIYKADGNIATAALNIAADVLGEDDPIFILVLGLSEDIAAPLTDTIILAGYNPDSQKAIMLSIPRDTFIGKSEATAGGYDKINALYQDSPEATVEAVKKLTGIEIAHYVLVKNTALPAIVSAIGEVEFDVPIDMNYDDPTQDLHIHLKAGVQMIDGDEAEQLLRFRHNNDGTSYPTEYGDNDYGRMRTQREFIKAVASQLVKGGSTANLKEIATAVFDNITTNMKLTKALAYAPSAVKLNIDSIRMEQLPGASEKINNLWFYKHNRNETYDLVNELLEELELDETEMKELYTPTQKGKTTSTKKTTTIKNETTVSNVKETDTKDSLNTHTHSYTSKVKAEATCESIGEEVFTCECGTTYTQTIPAKGHAMEEIKTETDTKITIEKICKNPGCNYREKPKVEHKEIEKNEPEEDNKNNQNDLQNKVEETHIHEYTISKGVITPATCTQPGKEKIACKCGDNKEKEIPLLGHKIKLEQQETDTEIITIETCGNTGCDYYKETKTLKQPVEKDPVVNDESKEDDRQEENDKQEVVTNTITE